MDVNLYIALNLIIPFLGTALGASLVFFMKDKINLKLQKILLGFASGVMIAASIWSLLIPSIDMSADLGKLSIMPAGVGFIVGIGFLLLLDYLTPHLHFNSTKPEGIKSKMSKSNMMVLAVSIHNIPEGMAVGVVLAGALSGLSNQITLTSSLILAIGIALQNFPEGAVVSMPLKNSGVSKSKSFFLAILSAIVEPIGAVLAILFTNIATPILPYVLSFAAGAMIYVVVEELIPEAQVGEHSNLGTIGLALGFVLMMVLDTTLG